MRHFITIRHALPCPSCGITDLQVVTVPVSSAGGCTTLPDGTYVGRVAECTYCWQVRARAIRDSRERLRAMGILNRSQPCGGTWMGADLGHEDLDPLENAIASDLLRAGHSVPYPTGEVVLRVASGRAEVMARALELQPA